MSKFLTPPIWYDKNGNLIEMLTGNAETSSDIAIGSTASAGGGGAASSVAIGGSADTGGIAIGDFSVAHTGIAIGPYTSANTSTSIAIGRYASADTSETIVIGTEASANTPNTIQIGNNSVAYTLSVGNGRMSLYTGSTAEGNWVSATSSGISQGLYLVRYKNGTYMNMVYLMAPITATIDGKPYKNDWYFSFSTGPSRINTGSAQPAADSSYYLKVDKNSTASNLQITPGYYRYDSDVSATFVSLIGGDQVMLFKIL